MSAHTQCITGVSAVAVEGRALMIEGSPGSGKSSLALALIDRGAALIGDDGVELLHEGGQVIVRPPPRIAGLLEIRGVGLVQFPPHEGAPLALILTLATPEDAPRLPETLDRRDLLGLAIPVLTFSPGSIAPGLRAEWAMRTHGLAYA
jgi:serine kinase of HPr protein (carbohydrate metabolism regulator)